MQGLEICAKDIFIQYTILNKNMVDDRKELQKTVEESSGGISQLLNRSWDDERKSKRVFIGTR